MIPDSAIRTPNRLISCTSPYLLQHAHNPVDWYPWGDEALAKAKTEDKPIFLSIGYSACHWCHVMERESFEDEAIANVLNEHFVPIKVDREERPDLDELYMEAVQAITGRGGWPMSVWLTPDLNPFFGGTYIPPRPHFGSPGFLDLLKRIAELWRERRQDILQDAGTLMASLEQLTRVTVGAKLPGPEVMKHVLEELRRSFDARWGGFSPAPKFPAHMAVDLTLQIGTQKDQAMAVRTLDAMWEGGMFDHLGGGFARYSTDDRWLVPHFEKMLYDNALLAHCYLDASLALEQPHYATIARETLDYLLREMRDEAGGFHSSEDADSEGEEGRYYTWTPAEIAGVLGDYDASEICETFGISDGGHLEGRSVIHRFGGRKVADAKMEATREKLRVHRDMRVHPGRDDKVLTAWNALGIRAFAKGYSVLQDERYLEAALSCANFIRAHLWKDDALLRVWRKGTAHTPGFLEDYAALANAMVDLYEASFDVQWLRWGEEIASAMLHRFEDRTEGGFYTAAPRADLIIRTKAGQDGALPSGNTLAIHSLVRLGEHLGREDFLQSTERALLCFAPSMEHFPRAHLAMLVVLDRYLAGATEVVIAGDPADILTHELLSAARKAFIPRGLITMTHADPKLPLHVGRDREDGIPAAYVCTKRACGEPVFSGKSLVVQLSGK